MSEGAMRENQINTSITIQSMNQFNGQPEHEVWLYTLGSAGRT